MSFGLSIGDSSQRQSASGSDFFGEFAPEYRKGISLKTVAIFSGVGLLVLIILRGR